MVPYNVSPVHVHRARKHGMGVARLLLCCLLLEDHNLDFGLAVSNNVRDLHSVPYATNEALNENDLPGFTGPIDNVTVASGREAILSCTVRKLGNYQVAWLRDEDRTVLSIGQRIVTHSGRFFISVENKIKNQTKWRKEEETTWRLHIRMLKEADKGCYMCQLNTKPMLSQLVCVDVLVAPDILTSGTSEGEVSVSEGENATLACKASGRPSPRVLWRREKNKNILVRGLHEQLERVDSLSGERLELNRVDRRQMGAYLCIASNEVPPAVSKRVYLRVNFSPSATVPNQLLGSPLGTDVALVCLIEAYPRTINFWIRNGQVIMNSGKYEYREVKHPEEEWKTTIELKIKGLEKTDLGEYTCSATSSMGSADATLGVYEIERATLPTQPTSSTWKRLGKTKAKQLAQITTQNHVYYQLSTPAMQKSTSRLVYNRQTTTTMDPRVPLTRDNAYKNDDYVNSQNSARTMLELHRVVLVLWIINVALFLHIL
ncbi:lachesin-like isoform X1 [Neodiprion fabricii]|uniref:lachesin-like isoform X1 n=2 Tax=Neodiprion TaxID=270857 RepID=UPI001ED8E81A|nr:lachesin-like isoform X1 [Neodiprion fabricii]XP_046489558.1 lachesin-like isoform X1 [Neodiprion pinetum]